MTEEDEVGYDIGDYWWEQRMDDAIFDARQKEGRCGQCGSFDGPSHICPHIQQLRNQVRRQSEEALEALRHSPESSVHPGMTCEQFDDMIERSMKQT